MATRVTQSGIEVLIKPGGISHITQSGIEVLIKPAPVPLGGIYYIKPTKTNDTVYTSITGGTGSTSPVTMTSVVPIPTPFAVMPIVIP
jgi:hypothetical protein